MEQGVSGDVVKVEQARREERAAWESLVSAVEAIPNLPVEEKIKILRLACDFVIKSSQLLAENVKMDITNAFK